MTSKASPSKVLIVEGGSPYPPWQGFSGVAILPPKTFDRYLADGNGTLLCTDNAEFQRHVLCQAAAQLKVAITTTDTQLKRIAKLYGVHLMK